MSWAETLKNAGAPEKFKVLVCSKENYELAEHDADLRRSFEHTSNSPFWAYSQYPDWFLNMTKPTRNIEWEERYVNQEELNQLKKEGYIIKGEET